ncbi:putative reverse transcriptase domain-containing protein [Tanacetum coccineum]
MLICCRKMPNTRSGASMTHEEVEELVTRRVAEEMEAREAARTLEPLNENGDEQEGENGGNGNGGNGENRNGNRNGNHGTESVDNALTWWNSHKRTIGADAAYAMNWARFMRLMTEVYCPRNEIQKMETKLWNLTVKGNDLTAYTQRFQELILLCTRMVPDEEDRVERFIGGLPDNIQGNVIAANPVRLQDAVRIANQLMDKKLPGYAARSAENKRRMESNPRDNRGQQPPFKRQNISGKDCPKLRSQNRGNQARNKNGNQTGGNGVIAKAYAIGGGGTNPDSNVITGTFLLNNYYATMLFDSGADRSFVSSTFSALLDVSPFTLDTSYAVELADGRISETNIVFRGCMLGLLGHPFDIDPMSVELGSFDVITGMDWLAKYHTLIAYDEKVICILYGDEVLICVLVWVLLVEGMVGKMDGEGRCSGTGMWRGGKMPWLGGLSSELAIVAVGIDVRDWMWGRCDVDVMQVDDVRLMRWVLGVDGECGRVAGGIAFQLMWWRLTCSAERWMSDVGDGWSVKCRLAKNGAGGNQKVLGGTGDVVMGVWMVGDVRRLGDVGGMSGAGLLVGDVSGDICVRMVCADCVFIDHLMVGCGGTSGMVFKMPNTQSGASMTHKEVEELVTRRVAEEMEAHEAARTLKPLNENGDEQEGENGGNGNGGNGGNGNEGNGENRNGNRNGNHGMNYGGFMSVARECSFQDFLKCKPHNFSGTEGVVGLTR